MNNNLSDIQLKIIKFVRLIVLIFASYLLLKGILIPFFGKTLVYPRMLVCFTAGTFLVLNVIRFNKLLKKNKIDGIRAIAYFISLGRCMSFSMILYAMAIHDISLIIFFVVLEIIFIFLPGLCAYALNKVKNILNEA